MISISPIDDVPSSAQFPEDPARRIWTFAIEQIARKGGSFASVERTDHFGAIVGDAALPPR